MNSKMDSNSFYNGRALDANTKMFILGVWRKEREREREKRQRAPIELQNIYRSMYIYCL